MINRRTSTGELQIYLVIWKNSAKLHLSVNQHQRIVDHFHECLIIIAILKTLAKMETKEMTTIANVITDQNQTAD